jgi:hypothetical protein
MLWISSGALLQFKETPPGRGGTGSVPRVEDETAIRDPGAGKHILCRSCRRIITHPGERIQMQGAHEYTFANPHGIVFQIGCFRSAAGCGYLGEPTTEFTWFRGFAWRVALCANCLINVGWLFAAPGGERFHGLILDRLIFPDR